MTDRLPDEVLANSAKDGNEKSFEELFNRYKKPIFNFIYRLIGNKETAQEVTQEVFIKVYNNLRIFDPNKKFSTWIYIIARNLAKNALRDKRYFRDVSLDAKVDAEDDRLRLKDVLADTGSKPDEMAEDAELAEEAQKVLDSMPLKYKEVVTLCCIQGLPYKEVSSILGCSIGSISMRLKEAKLFFMRKLGIEIDERELGSDET